MVASKSPFRPKCSARWCRSISTRSGAWALAGALWSKDCARILPGILPETGRQPCSTSSAAARGTSSVATNRSRSRITTLQRNGVAGNNATAFQHGKGNRAVNQGIQGRQGGTQDVDVIGPDILLDAKNTGTVRIIESELINHPGQFAEQPEVGIGQLVKVQCGTPRGKRCPRNCRRSQNRLEKQFQFGWRSKVRFEPV